MYGYETGGGVVRVRARGRRRWDGVKKGGGVFILWRRRFFSVPG